MLDLMILVVVDAGGSGRLHGEMPHAVVVDYGGVPRRARYSPTVIPTLAFPQLTLRKKRKKFKRKHSGPGNILTTQRSHYL